MSEHWSPKEQRAIAAMEADARATPPAEMRKHAHARRLRGLAAMFRAGAYDPEDATWVGNALVRVANELDGVPRNEGVE